MNRLFQIGIFILLTTGKVAAQTFSITQVEMEGAKLNIYYVLLDTVKTNQYVVKLFSSRDNYLKSLKHVTGDVGVDVTPGNNKKIVFDISNEFGADFEEKIRFQIKGSLYMPFIKLNENYSMLKRGKSYEFTWMGGKNKEVLTVELLRENKKVLDISSGINENRYRLKLPTSIKTGKLYQLKFYDSQNEDNVVFTNEFSVKRKIPLVVLSLPFIALGSVLLFMPPSTKSNTLPDPIKP